MVETMHGGDYMIHVFVEKVKNIKAAEEATVDPMVVVEVLGKKKYTTAKDDIGGASEVVFNEHIFFEPRDLTWVQAE